MAEDPPVPEFTLPDWGTDGAPPEPSVPDDVETVEQIEISVERPMLITAGGLPADWKVHTIHGLVTGHAKSDRDDLADASESACAKAAQQVSERAARLGANGVIDVSFTIAARKSKIVATAWGTAVSFSR